MRRLKDLSAYSLTHGEIMDRREGVELLALARFFGMSSDPRFQRNQERLGHLSEATLAMVARFHASKPSALLWEPCRPCSGRVHGLNRAMNCSPALPRTPGDHARQMAALIPGWAVSGGATWPARTAMVRLLARTAPFVSPLPPQTDGPRFAPVPFP
jgi:hypothetical protein